MGLMRRPAHVSALLIAATVLCAPAAAAELYKWVDERGVTNYSNTPPAGKPAAVVEDRLSIYTPEEPVTEALERAKKRPARPPQPTPPAGRGGELERTPVAPPPIVSDPCNNSSDPNCRGYLYDSFPVFQNRRHPAPLPQPQLAPGTTAGNVTAPNNYIPGQSGSAPPPAPPFRTPPGKSGPSHRGEGDRSSHGR
jgi:hypothetical protein